MHDIWGRRRDETDAQWTAFQSFLDGIQMSEIARVLSVGRTTIYRWKDVNHWDQRAAAYRAAKAAHVHGVVVEAVGEPEEQEENPIRLVLEGETEAYKALLRASKRLLGMVEEDAASLSSAELRLLDMRRDQASVLLRWWSAQSMADDDDDRHTDLSDWTDEELEQLEAVQRRLGVG